MPIPPQEVLDQIYQYIEIAIIKARKGVSMSMGTIAQELKLDRDVVGESLTFMTNQGWVQRERGSGKYAAYTYDIPGLEIPPAPNKDAVKEDWAEDIYTAAAAKYKRIERYYNPNRTKQNPLGQQSLEQAISGIVWKAMEQGKIEKPKSGVNTFRPLFGVTPRPSTLIRASTCAFCGLAHWPKEGDIMCIICMEDGVPNDDD